MKEIVDRLHENRQIELAKSILEAKGYEVSSPHSLEEYHDGAPISTPAISKACDDLGINLNSLEFNRSDYNYPGDPSTWHLQSASKIITGCESRALNRGYVKVYDSGGTTEYVRYYEKSNIMAVFDYSDPHRSSIVLMTREPAIRDVKPLLDSKIIKSSRVRRD